MLGLPPKNLQLCGGLSGRSVRRLSSDRGARTLHGY